MRSYWIRRDLKSMMEMQRHRHTERRDGHVKREVETRVMLLHAKKPPEDRRRQGRILCWSTQREHGATDSLVRDFEALAE